MIAEDEEGKKCEMATLKCEDKKIKMVQIKNYLCLCYLREFYPRFLNVQSLVLNKDFESMLKLINFISNSDSLELAKRKHLKDPKEYIEKIKTNQEGSKKTQKQIQNIPSS